jgi:hypothetical protein
MIPPKRTKVFAGKKTHRTYHEVRLEKCIGKAVEAMGWGEVESAYGNEPLIVFYFSDGTKKSIVMPAPEYE